MRHRLLAAGAALVALFAVLASQPSAALAATPHGAAGFAARARSAGLSPAQIRSTQHQVQAFIKSYGGRQVALNLVDFRGGNMLFVVPGRDARAVANASAGKMIEHVVSSTCPVTAFCAWEQENYAGTRASFFSCGTDFANPFGPSIYDGSWKNDQSPQDGTGPKVKFLLDTTGHGTKFTTPAPWAGDPSFHYDNDDFFRVC
jgi:hypothetical protein